MMNIPTACALLAALTLAAPAALAESVSTTLDLAPASSSQLWLNVGGFSQHFKRQNGYNENNLGLGIEYRTSPEISYMAGSYYNSVRKNTTYAAVNWQPWSMGAFKLGAAVGLMNGYPAMNRGGNFFAALPMVTYEGRRFGINVGLIPSIKNVDGAVIVQFKVRMN
ncbi:hypothetical protein [Hydrogenophaga sp.]|uniref:hypothetical protein n=1 Tax=Hydrogenophaga sp. TaxID=1904254 RepID=UPI0027303D5D|nr:hypothetical protein [Hydrogenophaga sp.]MDP2018602.1 hypothetical protein [Hydrogenophaga sp.]